MGYLTTITIYNDGSDQIAKYPEKFAKKVTLACNGDSLGGSFGLGYHSNLVTVQKPRHADDHTLYVHLGNTVHELNAYSKDTALLIENNEKYFDDMLKFVEGQVKMLKKLKASKKAKV